MVNLLISRMFESEGGGLCREGVIYSKTPSMSGCLLGHTKRSRWVRELITPKVKSLSSYLQIINLLRKSSEGLEITNHVMDLGDVDSQLNRLYMLFIPHATRVIILSAEEMGTMSKNSLRGITLRGMMNNSLTLHTVSVNHVI